MRREHHVMRGRDWSYGDASPGLDCGNHQKLQEASKDPLHISEGARPHWHLDLDFWPADLWNNTFLVFQSVVPYYSSPRKVAPGLSQAPSCLPQATRAWPAGRIRVLTSSMSSYPYLEDWFNALLNTAPSGGSGSVRCPQLSVYLKNPQEQSLWDHCHSDIR